MKTIGTLLLAGLARRRRHKLGHVFARLVLTGEEPVSAGGCRRGRRTVCQ